MTIHGAGFYGDVHQASNAPSREAHAARYPSIKNQPRRTDRDLINKVAKYLEGGNLLGVALGWSNDAFEPNAQTSLDTLTDGEWVWPGDAAYYCRTYGILPPERDFIDKIVQLNGECPKLDDATLMAVTHAWDSGSNVTSPEDQQRQVLVTATHLAGDAAHLVDLAVAAGVHGPLVDHLKTHSESAAKLRDEIHDQLLTDRDLANGAVPRKDR